MKTISFRFFFPGLALFIAALAMGQKSTVDPTTPIAVDPNVRIGKLDNGLMYYIRKNEKPEKRVELRLVVNAGSILENDGQQGLAHFMEHMNFNGSKTFPKNELVDFLQKTGVRFGADINAYTGFDETVYMLQLPTDDSLLVEKGYQVLEDWGHNALLDDREIDKERGVIVEEWRMGLGAQDRMLKKVFPIAFQGSKYAERIPIGKVDIIENFKHDSLRAFYHDWYRPDLMAVVVVGDINPDQAEARIRAHFSGISNPVNQKPRTVYDIPDNKDPLIAIATDKEATYNMVLLFYKHPKDTVKTLGDFRDDLIGKLYTEMLNQRFSEITQKPESPFIMASSEYGQFLARTKDSYVLTAMSKENEIDKSLATLLEENERVKRFGFTATEFEREKDELLSRYEQAAKEFDKTESARLCGEYVDNYLSQDPIPGPQKEFKYVKNLLPGIQLDEVNAKAREWITGDNLAIVIMAPDKENVKVPAEAEVRQILAQSRTAEITPYVDKFTEQPLVAGDITKGSMTGRKENPELGYTELTLSNGVTVVLKPTTFKNDEILVSAYSPGGNSLYPDNEFMSAYYAADIVDMSGAGNFDNIALEKKLKGKNVSVSPYIEDVKEGFRGHSTPKDFETLLQLIYLYFTGPRKDTTAFKAFVSQMETQSKFIGNNPIYSFYDTLYKIAYPGYHRMILLPSAARLKEINLDQAYQVYRDRFADAGDFKFFIVGNFTIDSITPLIEQYLGSLPSLHRNETWKDVSPKFAEGKVNLTLNKGTDPQGMVGIVMEEPLEWKENNLVYLRMLQEVLSIKLVEVIREKLSGVYSPRVIFRWDEYPKPTCDLIINFGCAPGSTDKLTDAVFKILKKIRKSGPTQVDLEKAKEALIRERETDVQKNSFWLDKLEAVYFNQADPALTLTYKDRVNAVTVDDLKKAADTYIDPEHYVRAVLKPQKK